MGGFVSNALVRLANVSNSLLIAIVRPDYRRRLISPKRVVAQHAGGSRRDRQEQSARTVTPQSMRHARVLLSIFARGALGARFRPFPVATDSVPLVRPRHPALAWGNFANFPRSRGR